MRQLFALFSHHPELLKPPTSCETPEALQDRPITLNDESQVCWLISLNCRGMMVVVVGSFVPVVIALHARWGERAPELTRSTSLHTEIGSVTGHFDNIALGSYSISLPLLAPTSHLFSSLLSLSTPPCLCFFTPACFCQLSTLGCSFLPRKCPAV